MSLACPTLETSSPQVNRAYRIAIADLIGNIHPFQDGLLTEPEPVLLAGLDYDSPWTRDAAINTWFGAGLLWPEVMRATLRSVLEETGDGIRIGGQYWDAVIWAPGAWRYYLFTGDRDFLSLALQAVANSLERFEKEEFDPDYGLFRGPAVYGDGVAAYPDRYSPGGTSSILRWVEANPKLAAPAGFGIPMMSLSTNCDYYEAYKVAAQMADQLNRSPNPHWENRAGALRQAIQRHFWMEDRGAFRYLVDPWGGCDHQEGLGHSFALLFGVATQEQAQRIIQNQFIAPAGIPCVWPAFDRYTSPDGQSFGRHSGAVWPHVQGFWAEACRQYGKTGQFTHEFSQLTEHINRDAQCAEIYHPFTGEIYGGLQEDGSGPDKMQWKACARQSWSASAYLNMVLSGLVGLRFAPEGISFSPFLPPGLTEICLTGLNYRKANLDIHLQGSGTEVDRFSLNEIDAQPFVPADAYATQKVEIQVK
jgi:hypothetical protein